MIDTSISVIIPVYNDLEGLRDTLDSLVNQDFEGDYEILPVDNNSTDNTGEVIKEFEKSHPDLVRGLEETEVQSSYAARNKGIEESKGDILAFIDADMWVEEDWLSKISSRFEEDDTKYLGCNVEIVMEEETATAILNKSMGFPVEDYLREDNMAPTCCLAVRKELFEEHGKFDDRLVSGGDVEFGKRIHQNGVEQDFAEDITMYHPARSSLKSLLKKRFRVGKGKHQRKKLYPGRFNEGLSIRNFLPTTPRRLANSIEGWEKLSWSAKIKLYFIYWLNKLANVLGYLYRF
jgi:glycosyltransferase involved in cell wall biosynthesis